jgi:hypothetical protein
MEIGKREDLLKKIQALIEDPEKVLEVRMARETIEIFDGLRLIETAPTGRVRIELIVQDKRKGS